MKVHKEISFDDKTQGQIITYKYILSNRIRMQFKNVNNKTIINFVNSDNMVILKGLNLYHKVTAFINNAANKLADLCLDKNSCYYY